MITLSVYLFTSERVDPIAIPDPGTRTHTYWSFYPIRCARTVIDGSVCYVQFVDRRDGIPSIERSPRAMALATLWAREVARAKAVQS